MYMYLVHVYRVYYHYMINVVIHVLHMYVAEIKMSCMHNLIYVHACSNYFITCIKSSDCLVLYMILV